MYAIRVVWVVFASSQVEKHAADSARYKMFVLIFHRLRSEPLSLGTYLHLCVIPGTSYITYLRRRGATLAAPAATEGYRVNDLQLTA